ncbi:MAG: PDGLE domain-containing protein [Desulfurococcus sp.]|nr:PDGLE domain-containing protein [Desulfurococcus sp.]
MKISKVLLAIVVLVLVSPVFGVILADLVGYHEPLDLAAEALGLKDITEEVNWTPLVDYRIPGLPDTIGYIVSGFIGVSIILAAGYILSRMVAEGCRGSQHASSRS